MGQSHLARAAPFLDVGDRTVVEAGMVFTIEPGLYSSTIGGVPPRRHCRRDPGRVLTGYPKDIESLTIPV